MPIFALIVWAIVMVGSMEKQPKFLDGAMAKKLFGVVFVGFFGIGVLVSFYYMILRFIELLGNYWVLYHSSTWSEKTLSIQSNFSYDPQISFKIRTTPTVTHLFGFEKYQYSLVFQPKTRQVGRKCFSVLVCPKIMGIVIWIINLTNFWYVWIPVLFGWSDYFISKILRIRSVCLTKVLLLRIAIA